jgi:protease I
MSPKALIITWSGFQDHELIYPYYRLLGAGFEVQIVAEKKDDLGRIYGIFGLNMPCHLLMDDFSKTSNTYLDSHDLLVIPGGVKALEKLRQQKFVLDFISLWNQRSKIIASTCHGAQLLISARVTAGRTISGYYSIKDDIENSGATYSSNPVVIDKNIISSPHYDHMGAWMESVLDVFQQSQ